MIARLPDVHASLVCTNWKVDLSRMRILSEELVKKTENGEWSNCHFTHLPSDPATQRRAGVVGER